MRNPSIRRLIAIVCAMQVFSALAPAFEGLVVTERFDGANDRSPATVALHDGGYVEVGTGYAAERSPRAEHVVATIVDSLESAGYSLARFSEAELAVVIHWGVLRKHSGVPTPKHYINPNFKARLAVVSTARIAGTLENHYLYGSPRRWRNPAYPTPRFVKGGDLLAARDRSQDDSIFVVLSAYDRAGWQQGESRLVWRTVLRAQTTAADVTGAIATFGAVAGDYVGRNSEEVMLVDFAPRDLVHQEIAATPFPEDDEFVQQVLAAERKKWTGEWLKKREAPLVEAVKPPL